MNKLILSIFAAAALVLTAGASTIVHYGTNDFSQATILGVAAINSNAVASLNLVPVFQTNGWVHPASSNYLGVIPSYAKATYKVTGDAFVPPYIQFLVSTDGSTWTNRTSDQACHAALLFASSTAGLTNLILWGFDQPKLYKKTNDMRYEIVLVDTPITAAQAANKSYVDHVHSDLSAWADFEAAGPVRLNSQPLLLDSAWRMKSDTATGTLQISHSGESCMSFVLPINQLHISSCLVTTNSVTLYVATNGVTAAPYAEWTASLDSPQWFAVTNAISSYPSAVGTNYTVSFPKPSLTAAYFRARVPSGAPAVQFNAVISGNGGGLTNLPASSIVGTLPPANLGQLLALLAQPVGSTIFTPGILTGASTNDGAILVNPTNGAVWVRCDGAKVAQTNFPALFSYLGTNWNGPFLAITNNAGTNSVTVGDGSATGAWQFRVPDFRGRVMLGASAALAGWKLGGEASHVITTNEMPSHTHGTYGESQISTPGGWCTIGYAGTYNCNYAPIPPGLTASAGGGQPHNTLPPFAAGHYWILAGYKLNNLWQ